MVSSEKALLADIILHNPLLTYFVEKSVEYGDSFAINCDAIGVPKVFTEWRFRSNPTMPWKSLTQNPFPILNFQTKHEGIYLCNVSNGIGEAISRTIRLRGQASSPPKIRKPSITYLNASNDDNLILNCGCELCESINEYQWEYEGFEKHVNKSGILSRGEWKNQVNYSLNLENISLNDAGLYTCHLQNIHGADNYTIQLNVKDSPKLSSSIEKDSDNRFSYIKCNKADEALSAIDLFNRGVRLTYKRLNSSTNDEDELVDDPKASIYSCSGINNISNSFSSHFSLILMSNYLLNVSHKHELASERTLK